MQVPFFVPLPLKTGSEVLLLGAGGGYDVVATLPIAIALRESGHHVHLASYSTCEFSKVTGIENARPELILMDEHSRLPGREYFCEGSLSRWWLQAIGERMPVWCFPRPGVRSMAAGLEYLRERLHLSSIIVVDGGVDGLFLGGEHDLGTPSMDAISIISAWTVKDCQKFYAFTAFGTEGCAYEVRHADALERVAELIRRKAALGVSGLLPGSIAGDRFCEALTFVHSEVSPVRQSIIASSVEAAMKGQFGETHLTPRTDWAPVWVSPLTLLYWFFHLDPIAEAKPYLKEVLDTDDVASVAAAIDRIREKLGIGARVDIPI